MIRYCNRILLYYLITFAGSQASTVLLNDSFTDNERSTQNLTGSAAWYSGGAPVDVSASGSLVFSNLSGAAGRGGLAYFTAGGAPQVLGIGDSITLAFKYSYGANNTSDYSFLFGLYNAGISRTSSDNQAFNNATYNSYVGYATKYTFGTVGSNRFGVAERGGAANNLLSSASYTVLGAQVAPGAGGVTNTLYQASMTVTYTDAATVTISSTIDGQALGSRTDTATLRTQFDTVGIFASQAITSLTIDDVVVTYSQSIPEPSVLLLMGLGAFIPIRKRLSRMT